MLYVYSDQAEVTQPLRGGTGHGGGTPTRRVQWVRTRTRANKPRKRRNTQNGIAPPHTTGSLTLTHSSLCISLGARRRAATKRARHNHDAHLAPMPSTPSRSYVRPVWRILSSGADCTCKQQPIRRRHRWACSGRSAPSFQPCAAVARRRSHACHQERIIAALTAHGPPPPFASPPAQIVVRHAAHISPEQRGIGKLSSTDHAHPSHPAPPASCHQPPPCCAPPRAR